MIRLAKASDCSAIYHLGCSRFTAAEMETGWELKRIHSLISENCSYVIEKNNTIVGFSLASTQCVYLPGRHIEWTAVATTQPIGAGFRLFSRVLNELKSLNDEMVHVDVFHSNHSALRLVKKCGFRRSIATETLEIWSI